MFPLFWITDFLLRHILFFKAFCSACMDISYDHNYHQYHWMNHAFDQTTPSSWDWSNYPRCHAAPHFLLDKIPHGTDYAVCIYYVFACLIFYLSSQPLVKIGSWNPKKALSINKVTHGEDGPKESAENRTRVVTSILVCTSFCSAGLYIVNCVSSQKRRKGMKMKCPSNVKR